MTRAAPPPAFLVSQWAVCGIVAAAARFVPVPLLDDMVRERAVQVAVSRTLLAHGRDYPSGRLSPLWGERPGQAGRMGRQLRALSLRVLLFPVRKYAAVFGAVRGVPNDVMRVVLLARTLDRRLDLGDLADADADRLGGRAVEIRRAVEEAIAGMDLRLLTALLADSLSQGRGLTSAAVSYGRRWVLRQDTEPTPDADGPVGAGAQRITEVLRRRDVAELLDRFDAHVDTALTSTH